MVDQWVDEDSDNQIDWLIVQAGDVLIHFQNVPGIVGDVANVVTGIIQLNDDCGAVPVGSDIIEISPVCLVYPNTYRINANNDFSAVVIHEARHAWQFSMRNAPLGHDDDGNPLTPTNDDDLDWLPEDTPVGSEADDIEDATAGSGDNNPDPWFWLVYTILDIDAQDFEIAHKND
jgi:hypothetical protein